MASSLLSAARSNRAARPTVSPRVSGGSAIAGSPSGPVARARYLALGKRLLGAGLTGLVLLLFVGGLAEQRWKEEALREQVTRQQELVAATEARSAELRDRLSEVNPDAYRTAIEATARRQLGLAYPNETIVLINWIAPAQGAGGPATPDTAGPAAPTPPHVPNWTRWLHFFLGK